METACQEQVHLFAQTTFQEHLHSYFGNILVSPLSLSHLCYPTSGRSCLPNDEKRTAFPIPLCSAKEHLIFLLLTFEQLIWIN